ncbi:hypothetical protein A9Q81_13165 [Gammaproteobacteria bacterium 42_54_T18]|nr:hypothetical protein A9Q81_13165 [Gammaproteobacteria bacterium 42_54_T18]
MDKSEIKEICPKCGNASSLKKLILLEIAWVDYPGRDSREKCALGLRADQVLPEALGEPPLEQFVSGFYCPNCEIGFVSEEILKEGFHPCM